MTLTPEDAKLLDEIRSAKPDPALGKEGKDLLGDLRKLADIIEVRLSAGKMAEAEVKQMLPPERPATWPPPFPVWDDIKRETAHIPRLDIDAKMAAIHERLAGFDKRLADAVASGDKTRERSLQHTIETHLRELERLREAKE